MKIKNAGLTLIELMVTLSVTVVAGSVIVPPLFRSVSKMYKTLEVNNMYGTLPMLQLAVRNTFERARAISFSSLGAASAGYLISDRGAFVLKSDMRDCAQFDPATSDKPENVAYTVVSCCGANEGIAAETPDKEVLSVKSACSVRGLSIASYTIQYNETTKKNDYLLKTSSCIPDVQRMSVFQSGLDQVNSSPLYSIELTSWKSNDELSEPTEENNKGRVLVFGSLGYSGSSLITDCQSVSSKY